jgi:hypothetical protein
MILKDYLNPKNKKFKKPFSDRKICKVWGIKEEHNWRQYVGEVKNHYYKEH